MRRARMARLYSLSLMPIDSPRLAIITGAAGALGRAFCRQVIAEPGGWHLVVIDLDAEEAAQTLAECRQTEGVTGQCEGFDVADVEAWTDLRERLQRDWPRLDLLVNSAGMCMSAEVGDGDMAMWRRVHEVNFGGVSNACHAITPWLKQSARDGDDRKPAVINVASIMGLIPTPALAAYCASKAAVIALTEAMHAELRPHGVHVTVAAPGFFASGLLDGSVFAVPQHREQADAMVRSSKIDAAAVAQHALRTSARGELYSVVGRRARWYWRLNRAAPARLLNALSRRYHAAMGGNEAGSGRY
jgi:NAD(P)-dependent dehydrogenase (short-subunit alcohol dehydrogenase family)